MEVIDFKYIINFRISLINLLLILSTTIEISNTEWRSKMLGYIKEGADLVNYMEYQDFYRANKTRLRKINLHVILIASTPFYSPEM